MPGCAASAAPASAPSPVTMLSAPARQTRLRRELGDAQQRQARVLGRLDDARVAGGERAADRAPEDLQRIVPRDDVAGDAVRLAPRQHRVARRVRNRLAVQLVARAARRTRSSARMRRRRRAPASAACRSRAPRVSASSSACVGDHRARAAASMRPRSVAVRCGPTRRRTRRARRAPRHRCRARRRARSTRTASPSDGSITGSVRFEAAATCSPSMRLRRGSMGFMGRLEEKRDRRAASPAPPT